MYKNLKNFILSFADSRDMVSISEIQNELKDISLSSLKRYLKKLVESGDIIIIGNGKSTKYVSKKRHDSKFFIDFNIVFNDQIHDLGLKKVLKIDIQKYYAVENRDIIRNFNFEVFNHFKLPNNLTNLDFGELIEIQKKFHSKYSNLSLDIRKIEMDRLAIDLSWKSSQIEGNTYTLLETELLLKQKITSSGRTKDEATMLLNHKEAIDFVVEYPNFLSPMTISRIEDIHKMLMKDLNITTNIRSSKVGISGTEYTPLDNEFQIRDALLDLCKLINAKENPFEKAFLALILISYIQPFVDGNKRTARIVSNSILIFHGYCPISYRTVDSLEYKKAMLLFYEQNNISAIKSIFIDQYRYAVETYF